MRTSEAYAKAIAAGASAADVEAETKHQARFVGTIGNNTIRALQLHTWHNTRADWVRLAAALQARAIKRRRR